MDSSKSDQLFTPAVLLKLAPRTRVFVSLAHINIVDLRAGALVLLIGAADLNKARINQRKDLYM